MMSPLNVFEVAIANAEGQWIIPPTIIHHQMTKRELFAVNVESLRNEAAFSKFYGDADETEARGMGERTATWRELGQELEAYLKRGSDRHMVRLVTFQLRLARSIHRACVHRL